MVKSNPDTTARPRAGDTIFFCVHLCHNGLYECAVGSHWYGLGELSFTAPNGDTDVARWYNCCQLCYQALNGNPRKLLKSVPLGGHVVLTHTPEISEMLS